MKLQVSAGARFRATSAVLSGSSFSSSERILVADTGELHLAATVLKNVGAVAAGPTAVVTATNCDWSGCAQLSCISVTGASATVTAANTYFHNSGTSTSGFGGAVYATAGATASMTDCVFHEVQARLVGCRCCRNATHGRVFMRFDCVHCI